MGNEAPEVTVESLQIGITQLCVNMYNKLCQLGNTPENSLMAIKDFLRGTANILETKEEEI